MDKKRLFFIGGVFVTAIIAAFSYLLAKLPYLSVVGQLVIAIMIGMLLKTLISVPISLNSGISFSNKRLLKMGIILLGAKLNIVDIYEGGWFLSLSTLTNILIAFVAVIFFAKLLKVDKTLSLLTACGTAICGAAAVVAIAVQIKAQDEKTATSIAVVALLGTFFTILYTSLFPLLPLSKTEYGLFAGGTLHEIAHVIAASIPFGQEAVEAALIAKLSRVLMLVPIAFIVGLFFNKNKEISHCTTITFPWFIIGFLIMSILNTFGLFTEETKSYLQTIAYLLISMAMGALGLQVRIETLIKKGKSAFFACLFGSLVLSIAGFFIVFWTH
ncbi:YeiH family protein [Priestia endophytica]|uniref:Integral membrane protein (TIGR00698 family) n=1 Tax=Priestia endophytica TaxID=135735 RepID=A0AAX1Q4K1_9BACI|nr:YeiH family protein [Priestia endophytica]RAS73350.1 hypothetical protein A3864_19635 [Priestia endophytica]